MSNAPSTFSNPSATRARPHLPYFVLIQRSSIVMWSLFIFSGQFLSGHTWIWSFPDSLPTVTLLVVPALFIAVQCFIRQQRIRWITLCFVCLYVSFPNTDLGRQFLPDTSCTPADLSEFDVTILSWNTQFWGEKNPGAALGETITKIQADIVTLQEVHLTRAEVIVDHVSSDLPADTYETILRKGELVVATSLPVIDNNSKSHNTPHLWVDAIFPSGRIVRIITVHIPLHISLTLRSDRGDFLDFIRARQNIRENEYQQLRNMILSSPHPVMVTGDFNSTSTMRRFKKTTAGLCDSIFASSKLGSMTWGFAGIRLWRPDYIFASEEISISAHTVLPMANISDHAAILASITDIRPQNMTSP